MTWTTKFAICPEDHKNFDKFAEYFKDEAEAEISAMEWSVALHGARVVVYKRRQTGWKPTSVIFA